MNITSKMLDYLRDKDLLAHNRVEALDSVNVEMSFIDVYDLSDEEYDAIFERGAEKQEELTILKENAMATYDKVLTDNALKILG